MKEMQIRKEEIKICAHRFHDCHKNFDIIDNPATKKEL